MSDEPRKPRFERLGPNDSEPPGWFDYQKNLDKIVYGLVALCALLLLIDLLIHKHPYFEIEYFWGFYGIYGFLACVVLVLAAKILRQIVMRSEDYYDD